MASFIGNQTIEIGPHSYNIYGASITPQLYEGHDPYGYHMWTATVTGKIDYSPYISRSRKLLYIIPARGNSKSVPRKNMLKVKGKTLIDLAIDQASESFDILTSKYPTMLDTRLIVVSSEDYDIVRHVDNRGAAISHMRPKELSMDDVQVDEVVPYVIRSMVYSKMYHYDELENLFVVVLQPTSVKRNVQDIVSCILKCVNEDGEASSMTGYLSSKFMYLYQSDDEEVEALNHDPSIRLGRQEWEANVFVENGSVYVGRADLILRNRTFRYEPIVPAIVPENRSIEIDEKEDLESLYD